ncbi:MAG TPA: TetR/AcrR family transcriptional regulator [Acetobacteraceae bacterium]|nr:TetR/AcrR family transcriptional regulator [Acetobacteraceae bacterium]
MPYPPEHRQETRSRILDAARRLFNRRGLTDVSIDEVMEAAGLTRGAFYSYFPSKEALYAEAITHFIDGARLAPWQCGQGGPWPQGEALARRILDAYLSDGHFADLDGSCPLIGLAADVARSEGPARGAYRQVLGVMTGAFAAHFGPSVLDDGANLPEQRALAVAAMCVGGMVLARAVDDAALAGALRAAAHRYAVALAGWDAPEAVDVAPAP